MHMFLNGAYIASEFINMQTSYYLWLPVCGCLLLEMVRPNQVVVVPAFNPFSFETLKQIE